jgi:hypothetical protein
LILRVNYVAKSYNLALTYLNRELIDELILLEVNVNEQYWKKCQFH